MTNIQVTDMMSSLKTESGRKSFIGSDLIEHDINLDNFKMNFDD